MNTNEYFQRFDPLLDEQIYKTAHENLEKIAHALLTLDKDTAVEIAALINDAQRFKWLVDNARSMSMARVPGIDPGRREWKLPKLTHINASEKRLTVRESIDNRINDGMKKIRIRIGDFIREYNFKEPQDVLDQLLLDVTYPPHMWADYSLAGDDVIEVSELIDEYIDAFPNE